MRTSVLLVVAIVLGTMSPMRAAGFCFQSCNAWCDKNRPTQSCHNDCIGRPLCKLSPAACFKWCASNKPGVESCKEDCRLRKG
jgi:hypothetical protein